MATFAENLARASEAASTGAAPPDLVRWLAETATARPPIADRAHARNLLLRGIAARLPGSRWARAKRLEREIAAAGRRSQADQRDAVRALVARALEVGPRARLSLRRLLQMLAE